MAAYYRESAMWGRTGAALEEGGVLCYASSTRFPAMMNGVIRTDARTSAAEVIQRARDFFSARSRGFTIWARTDFDDDIAAANTLQASVMGDPIYRRMGYEEGYRYRGYLRVPTEK